MAALASGSTTSPRALELELHRSGRFSDKASSSGGAESSAVAAEGGCEAEEGVLDLDSPWVAATEAESRLEEAATAAGVGLCLLADEELEEYEIRDNQQRQEDELTALEAIYGDDLIVFENKGGLRSFQIYIHYHLPDGIKVCAKLSAPNASPRDVGWCDDYKHDDGHGPDEFSYTCDFEYLPPLILTCLLPRSYPSKDPPSFAVTAKWMDGPYVSQLCQMLDTIWAGLPGQEVVYQWVEWLHNSSMSYLWIDGNMTLGPDIVNHNGDNRAISTTNSLESVIPLMLNYSSKKRYQAFLEAIHMCMICLNQTKDSHLQQQFPLLVLACMETLCRLHVKEGSVFQLVCPDSKCKDSIPPYVLKRLLTEAEYERWDRLLLQKTLDSMSNVVYCPNCVIGCMEDDENNAQCPKCSFIFCSFCKGPCHPGKKCLTPEEKIQLRKVSGRMTEKEMAQELFNTDNCTRMFGCARNAEWPSPKLKGATKWDQDCKLFAARDIAEWERQMAEIQPERLMRNAARPIGSTVRCHKCRAQNFKKDEKYM
ncbi:unnamed protein product [Miscanthus lutarioriparius]|uniref:RBR-type E3 ubiquitin transferase n=1 Tax=Miscanthus lutarioriparius TaxID=422564 RepID=A0A811QSF5_9POAL|nr:unnamed protein product [Miscanthus lutarioriparius]